MGALWVSSVGSAVGVEETVSKAFGDAVFKDVSYSFWVML